MIVFSPLQWKHFLWLMFVNFVFLRHLRGRKPIFSFVDTFNTVCSNRQQVNKSINWPFIWKRCSSIVFAQFHVNYGHFAAQKPLNANPMLMKCTMAANWPWPCFQCHKKCKYLHRKLGNKWLKIYPRVEKKPEGND